MAIASDDAVQHFIDEVIRPLCSLGRAVDVQYSDALTRIDDVYAALTQATPTWEDTRTGVPVQATAAKVLAVNSFLNDIRDAIKNHAQYSVVRSLCTIPANLE